MTDLNQINVIMSTQLSEKEVMIYLWAQTSNYRDIAKSLGISHNGVAKIYNSAKKKIDVFAEAGIFQTPVPKTVDNIQ